jgi:hypothetical protein
VRITKLEVLLYKWTNGKIKLGSLKLWYRFIPKGRPTSGCTRLPTARFFNHILPANKPLIEGSLAVSAAREPQALGGFVGAYGLSFWMKLACWGWLHFDKKDSFFRKAGSSG